MIWAGFGAMIFASIMSWVVTSLPPASTMPTEQQTAVTLIFGQTWRIVLASLVAFWAGEFVNSYVLAKMKIFTAGKYLWTRTIGSTIAGEAVDSLIFYPVAFYAAPGWSTQQVVDVMIGNYFLKVFWEVIATPVTYKIVAFLKRVEHEDYYDRNTDFNPFTLSMERR
jgi:queuosine precursor transporter